jgi:N-sulfoglucosamine sulfohydrolase
MNHPYYLTCRLFILLIFVGACQPKPATGTLTTARKPNILLCIADDASFPHMGAYGTSWIRTPAFDRIAREGILFTRAYTPNAKCAPSRACLLTGRNSWQLEEAANHSPDFPSTFKTFMEALGENGYFVGHTLKGWAPGNPGEVNGRRRELTGKAFNQKTLTPPTSGISRIDYAENFRDFLNERPVDEPFCFWYGSVEPHRAYEYAASLKQGRRLNEVSTVPAYWPDTDTVRTDMLDYALELEYFDSHIAKMLRILEEAGELENTIILVTADNGMPFPRVKGQAYEASNHLPLALMWKNGIATPGRRVDDFVSFIDLAPTFLELAGIPADQSGMQPITGTSLTDILFSDQGGTVNPERDHVLIGKERHDVGRPNDWGYPIRGIVQDTYLYVKNYQPTRWPAGNPETGYLNTDGGATKSLILNQRRRGEPGPYWQLNFGKRSAEELYDLRRDPDCITNLATDPQYTELLSRLRTRMEAELTAQEDPRMLGNGDIFDQYPYSGEVRGFYERYRRGEKPEASWVNPSDFETQPLEQ